jgi:hypothetical protein
VVVDPPFIHALRCFSDLPSDETEALYAVRCALAHDYSLFSNPPKGSALRRHVFTYTAHAGGPVVQLRKKQWNGVYSPVPSLEETTTVNLRGVGDLVEGVVTTLRSLHRSGELVLRIKVEELSVRFGMFYTV